MFFDSRGFRGNPDPFEPIEEGLIGVERRQQLKKPAFNLQKLPPLHSATDYRPKCASNIPSSAQAATRQWLTKSADEVIEVARKRHEARIMDLQPPYSPVSGPGFERIVACNTDRCAIVSSGNAGGIGIYRREELPPMQGTWTNAYAWIGSSADAGSMTYRREEGGRNTRR